jgi:hypothetical protein
MTRRTADLFRAEDRIDELEAENETLRGILRKLSTAPAMELMHRSNGVYFLDVDDCTVDLSDAEAALFDTITDPKETPE